MYFLYLMNYLAVEILLAVNQVNAVNNTTKCISIRKVNYEKETIYSDLAGPYHLTIDYDTNTLFFTYNVKNTDFKIRLIPTFEINYLNLKSNEFGSVNDVHGGFATAINRKAHKVYMGGEDGIYKYDYETNTGRKLNIYNGSILHMFYRNGLYFTTFPDERVFFYKHDVIELPEFKNKTKVKMLAVMKDRNYVFANTSGLYTYNRANKTTHLRGILSLNGFTSDIDGNLYFSTSNSIYYINETTNQIVRLTQINDIYGFAVEKDGNMIYSNSGSIIRLKPTKQQCANETTKKP